MDMSKITNEIWKDIPGYERLYQVSNLGRIRSSTRESARGHQLKGKILKLWPNNRYGYLAMRLYKNGKPKTYYVHRLVLEIFAGNCPDGMEACHIINDPQNNRLDNLKWGTPKENQRQRIEDGTDNRGERCVTAKLTEKQVLNIRRLHEIQLSNGKRRYTQKQLSKKFNISESHISYIINKKTWRHI